MKKLIIIIFIYNNLYSYSFIDSYRENGMRNLKKSAEKFLKSKDFWLKRLKYYDTDFGYYENLSYLILVNKHFPSLDLYKFQDEQFKLIQINDILIGKNRGDKKLEGDRKTPTGVYNLTNKFTKLDQFYGPLALVISYPNIFDKLKGRTGSGIWIHGYPFNGERDNFTKGCVALKNDRLLKFDKLLTNFKNSIVIFEDGVLKKVKKNDLAVILSSIYKWLDGWRENNFKKYISFYSSEFKRFDGNDLKWFVEYKRKIFKKKEKKEIFFSNINISPYPNRYERNIFIVTFHEKYLTSKFNWSGKKELFVEVIGEKMQIIIEK